MNTHFRPALPADIPALVDIECRAFGRDTADGRRLKQLELEHELRDYVVLEAQGRPVAAARILRHPLQVGSCAVLKGDVGHVAVLPEEQGRGYGTKLMQMVGPHMREQGFHLSRLGGLMAFYSRFGYEPFLRRYVRIPVEPPEIELKGRLWADLLALSEEQASHVEAYDPSLHATAVHSLRLRVERGRCGLLLLNEAPPQPTDRRANPEGLDWVYVCDGRVRSFLRGGYGLVNAGDTHPSYRLDELLVDCGCPSAAGALVKTLLLRASAEAPTTVSCRLPYDERLFGALTDAGVAYEVSELRQANDGNMMQVVDLRGALAAVRGELSARLRSVGLSLWQGAVRLVLPGQQACLQIGAGEVAVGDGEAEAAVKLSQAEFIRCLLGINGFGEFENLTAQLPPAAALTLGVLFPRRPCASGAWG